MTDKCKYHAKSRADWKLPANQLCGFHHVKNWDWCSTYRGYQAETRWAKARAKADVGATGENEAITTEMS